MTTPPTTPLLPRPPRLHGHGAPRRPSRSAHFKMPITLAIATSLLLALAVPAGARATAISTFRLRRPAHRASVCRTRRRCRPPPTQLDRARSLLVLADLLGVAGTLLLPSHGHVAADRLRRPRRLRVPRLGRRRAGLVPVTGLLFGAVSLVGAAHLRRPRRRHRRAGRRGQRRHRRAAAARRLRRGRCVASIDATTSFVGLIGAMVGGVLVAFVLAAFSIKYLVDQVIVGVVLNVLVVGPHRASSTARCSRPNEADCSTRPVALHPLEIPLLGDIPDHRPGAVQPDVHRVPDVRHGRAGRRGGCYRTRWGLRLRAVGEHPQAADTVGIKVNADRFWNVSLAGAIAGLGGAYFTLGLGAASSPRR